MKKLLTYLSLLVMLSLMRNVARAQVEQVVNITTGKATFVNQNTSANTPFIADDLPDGNWTVMVPGNPNPQPAIVGTPTNLLGNLLFTPVPTAKWISDGTSSDADGVGSSPVGDYIFQLKFYVSVCNITSGKIMLNTIGADNFLTDIWLNNNPHHNVSYGFISYSPGGPFLNNGASVPPNNISLSASELQPGWNTLNMMVNNPPRPGTTNGPSYMGLIVDGAISVKGDNALNFSIRDINGNKKTSYCVGENIFLYVQGMYTAGYTLSLCEVDNAGNPISSPVTTATIYGPVNGVNITNVLSGLLTLQGGHQYRLSMTLMGNSCQANGFVDFTMNCCELSTDPSFWTRFTDDGKVVVESSLVGTHNWKVYQVPLQNLGSYTLVNSYNTPSFSFNAWGGCYYITHTTTTACGTSCIGQTICPTDCEQKTCNLSTPENLQYDQSTNTITWSNIPGATYLLEITIDDPACCDAPGWTNIDLDNLPTTLPITYKTTKVIPCSTNEYVVNFSEFGLQFKRNCFSYRVIAVCPDGGRSTSGTKCSSGENPEPQDKSFTVTTAQDTKVNTTNITELSLYPSPSKGTVSVDVTTTRDVEFSISIYDLNGKLVKFYEGLQTTGGKASIKVHESLSKGMYLVKVLTSEQQLAEKKLIVE